MGSGEWIHIREGMKEAGVEQLVERAREFHPSVKPRMFSDHGSQFIAGDFKLSIRLTCMTHMRSHRPRVR